MRMNDIIVDSFPQNEHETIDGTLEVLRSLMAFLDKLEYLDPQKGNQKQKNFMDVWVKFITHRFMGSFDKDGKLCTTIKKSAFLRECETEFYYILRLFLSEDFIFKHQFISPFWVFLSPNIHQAAIFHNFKQNARASKHTNDVAVRYKEHNTK